MDAGADTPPDAPCRIRAQARRKASGPYCPGSKRLTSYQGEAQRRALRQSGDGKDACGNGTRHQGLHGGNACALHFGAAPHHTGQGVQVAEDAAPARTQIPQVRPRRMRRIRIRLMRQGSWRTALQPPLAQGGGQVHHHHCKPRIRQVGENHQGQGARGSNGRQTDT